MKVWLLLSRFEVGGLERVQANLASALGNTDLQIWIVAGKIFPQAQAMIPAKTPRLEIAPRNKYTFIFSLLAQLKAHRPDIVMTTSNDVACMVLIFRTLFFPKMKVVCAQHLSISAPWKTSKGIQKIKHRAILWMMHYLLPGADSVIAVSAALAQDMQQTLQLKKEIQVIHNPVVMPNLEVQSQEKFEWPWPDKSVPTLVFVGRLAKVKRLDLLLQAFFLVTKTTFVNLLIIGDGPEKTKILDFLTVNDLHEKCKLIGYQDNPLPWIKASSILVLPSDYEGFGNVLVEAMACGTQVIATDCPSGPAEILEQGRYGQLVPINNSHALAHAMQRALSKEFEVPAQTLMQRAQHFSLERAASAYLSVIHEAAQNSPCA